jgi:hypothetical protein
MVMVLRQRRWREFLQLCLVHLLVCQVLVVLVR